MLNKLYRLLYPAKDPYEIKEKYGIPNVINIRIDRDNRGNYIVTSKELPGLITETNDLNKLLDVYNDAVLTYFDVPKREADVVFNQMNIEGVGTLTLKLQEKCV